MLCDDLDRWDGERSGREIPCGRVWIYVGFLNTSGHIWSAAVLLISATADAS